MSWRDDSNPDFPLVSIVTPSFNQAAFVEATVRSVLDQDYPNIEYIVMDGGSTDGTLEILERYRGRLTWVSEPDGGQSDAIDRGFARSRGSILAWLNSDDVYLPGAVSSAVRVMREDASLGLVYGRAQYIDRNGAVTGRHMWTPWSLKRLITETDYVPQPATFFTRVAYERVGGLDRTLQFCMDYDLWIKIGLVYPARGIPDFWAQMRLYREAKTASGGLPRVAEIKAVVGRYGRSKLPVWLQWDFVRESWRAGLENARNGNWREAGRSWAGALPTLLSPYVVVSLGRVVGRRIRRLGTWAAGFVRP